MEWEFYGNESVQQALHQMLLQDRAPHGILFYGEPGLGKKTLARRFAAEMLCTGTEKPCGVCKSCRMLHQEVHPDVRFAEHSGKRGGFSVETVRSIGVDLMTPPNEGKAKFYIFGDCDAMDARSQNLLLKAVEEPPAYAYFIFTATAPTVLLSTIRSRIVSMALSPVSEQLCMTALLERQYTPQQCQDAVSAFHGNIGQCLLFLENDGIREIVRLTKSAINSIINRNEYDMLKTVFEAGKERETAKMFLTLFDRTLRDAAAWKVNAAAEGIGCDAAGAMKLSRMLSMSAGQMMHHAVGRAYQAIAANVNLSLVMTAFCAECMCAGG